jgi:hypothetical protein
MNDVPIYQALNNRHLSLLELLLGVTTSGVREVDGMADLNVIGQGDILHFDTVFIWIILLEPPDR